MEVKETIKDKSLVFEPGDKVHYVATHLRDEPLNKYNVENGIVKIVRSYCVFVVYHCDGQWEKYHNYTGQLTEKTDLRHGWLE